jgi:unsaturated rhamnogalacturonyl hydrolase
MYDTKILIGGVIDGYQRDTFQLDSINAGKMLFELYKTSDEEKYRIAFEALRQQLKDQPRTKSGGFWHKKGYPNQMWLDGLYMAGPFLAQYAAEYGQPGDFTDIVKQLTLAESHTRDTKTGLLYHAWDESRSQPWANKETGTSPHFWGRAMGWYCMALVDVLDFIPESRKLIDIAQSLVGPLQEAQDAESGLWYQVLEPKAGSAGVRGKNYLESSASAMFVYFFLKMLRKGYTDASNAGEIKDAALKGYAGLVRDKITCDADGELHLLDTCGGCGLGKVPGDTGPYRDGSFEYYVNERICVDDFKGIGPFILASLEVEAHGCAFL